MANFALSVDQVLDKHSEELVNGHRPYSDARTPWRIVQAVREWWESEWERDRL
jgi:hypothetical protein